MAWNRALATVVAAACLAMVSLQAPAQTRADGKRQKVDVRGMLPGPQGSDTAAEPRPVPALTRDQRKAATMQARQAGTLQPAGEAAGPAQLAAATPPPAKKDKGRKARLAASAPA